MDLSQESSTDTFNKLHDHVKEGFILDSYTEKIPPSPSGTLNSPLENSVQVIVQATTQDTTGPSGFSPILESASEPHENNQEKNVEISLIAPSKEFQSHLSLGSLHEFSHESAQPFIEELAQDLSEVSLVDFDEPIQTHSEKLLLNSSEDNKLVGPERLNQDKSDLSSQESIKENLQKSSDSLSSMQTDTVQDPIQENVIESRVTAETFSPELIYEPNEKPQTLPKETPLIQNESKVEINDDSNQSFAFTNEDSFFDNIDKVEATIPETLDEPSADGVPSSTSHDDPFVSSKTEGGYFGSLKTSDNHLTSAAIQKYPLSSSPVRDEFSTEDILSDPVKGSLRPNDDDWHDTNLVNSQPVKGSTNLVSKADNFSVPIEPTQHSETESTDNLVEDDSVEKVSIEEKELPKITPDNFSPELHPFVPKKSNRNSLFANDMDDAFFLALASEDSSKDEKTKSHKKRHSLFGGNYSEDPFFTSLEKLTSTVEEDETVNETKVDSELIDSFKEKENVQESSIPETEVTEDNLFVTNDNNDPFVFIQSEDSNKTQFSEQMDKDLSVSNLTSEETGASAIELNPFELLEDDEDFLDDEVNETTTSKEGSRPAMKPEASFAFLADDDDILSDEDNSNIIENVYTAPGHTTAVTQNSQKHLATLTNNTNRATSNAYDFPTNLLARNLTQPAVPTFMNVQQQSSQASKMNANPVNLARPHSSLASKTSSKSFFGDLPLPNKRPANRVASAQPLIIQPSLSPLVGVPPRLSTMTPPSNPYAPKVVPASPSINRNFAVSPTILFANNGLSNNHTAGMTLSPSIPEDKPINNLPPQAFNPSPMYASNSQIQPGTPAHNSYAPAAQQYAHASHSRNISGGYNSPILRSSSVASNSSRLNDGSVPLKRPSLATSTISSTTNSAYGDLPFAFEQPARKHDNMRRIHPLL
ncbi:hypothetical protein NADFUDRAFT_68461 [Nadsonia fulvescens var. elongata DSM 6958]|uniref:Uncharacterized protein n=1 Tax=Nadsonia fulvescens var. elongata DSM 6958 TaxID=857566 RepID=A0A1E3PRW9_9ASCO|nr:hypothetical protein NADFUDRAFT_68461 [Nadsonia fulvescens var. elongata DSM 6958]